MYITYFSTYEYAAHFIMRKIIIYLGSIPLKTSPDKYASQFGAGSSYAYFHDEDESTFHLVDTTRVQKPYQSYQRGRARGQRGRGARGARTPGGMTTLNKVKIITSSAITLVNYYGNIIYFSYCRKYSKINLLHDNKIISSMLSLSILNCNNTVVY